MKKQFTLFVLVILAVLVASCASGAEPAASPTSKPATATLLPPTATDPPPSATPTATNTLAPQIFSSRGKHIRDQGVINIGIRNDDMYPMFFEENGEFVGFEIDLAGEIAFQLFGDQIKIEWIQLSVQQRILAVQNGDVDFLIRNLTHTKSREEQVLFTSNYFLEGNDMGEPLAIAVSRIDPVFRDELDSILLAIIAGGTWQEIYDLWFDQPPLWNTEIMLAVPPADR